MKSFLQKRDPTFTSPVVTGQGAKSAFSGANSGPLQNNMLYSNLFSLPL